MSETNEFINKLMNKNNEELDNILSFADGIKTENTSGIKQSADDILGELFDTEKKQAAQNTAQKNTGKKTDNKSIISENKSSENKSKKNNKKSFVKDTAAKSKSKKNNDKKSSSENVTPKTDSSKDTEFTRKIITSDFPADTVQRNLHHVLFEHECEYISFSSICEGSRETSAPIIKDEAVKVISNFETREIKLLTPDDTSAEKTEAVKPADTTPSYKPEIAANLSDELNNTLYDDVSDAEKFISMQGVKHPKIFFVIGLSIFSLALLGLISCAYLGLNAMKKFTQNYQPTQTTSACFITDETDLG